MQHPNIIWLHEIIDNPEKEDDLYLVTEYHSNGSIGDIIKKINNANYDHNKECRKHGNFYLMKTKGLKNQQARDYFIDMLKALFYCHKVVNVIHRDIKPDNIMINHNQEAVLIDFGVSFIMMKDT